MEGMDFDTQTLSRSPSCIQTRAKPQVTASWIPACLKSLGVGAMTPAVCATLSAMPGMPRTLFPPFSLGISTARRVIHSSLLYRAKK